MTERRPPGSDRLDPLSEFGEVVEGVIDDLEAAEAAQALVRTVRRFGIDVVRKYHRQHIDEQAPLPEEAVLVVSNHGFGGIFDLNVFALLSALDRVRPDRPATFLTHQLAWTLGVGALIEAVGARPASRDNALDAFRAGHDVVVFPGGDLEAGKSWRHRNEVRFSGRSGFARLALDAHVPIVPVVTAGAGGSLLVLTDGRRLAEWLRLPALLRYRVLPVSLSLPWGLSVGAVGMVPYLPLPVRLDTAVLPAVRPQEGETASALAARVQHLMQEAMDGMVRRRRSSPGR